MSSLEKLARKLARPALDATRIYRWSQSVKENNFPEQPRKSPAEIRRDLHAWEERFGMYDYSYFEYGADIVGKDIANYMPYDVFKAYRRASNRAIVGNDDFSYECVLDDKFVFDRFATASEHPVPEMLALVSPEGFRRPAERERRSLDTFAHVLDGTVGILKPVVGGGGASVFGIEVDGGRVRVDGEPTDMADLMASLGTMYVVQDLVRQHSELARFNESSVNTIRLITVHEKTGSRPLSAAFKVGAAGVRVDNWVWGGLVVLVDVESGKLQGPGIYKKDKPVTEAHPESGIRFDGFELPCFAACVRAACDFHDDLYGFHSVGWDIAVTEEGPVFIEGNAGWDGYIPITLDPSFVSNYLDALGEVPPRPYRHQTVKLINMENA